jgi:glycosyltransferase involved in cell wall biosynthesis
LKREPTVLLVGTFLSASGHSRSVCEDLAQRLLDSGWHVITTSSKPGRVARLIDMLRVVWRFRADYTVAHVDVFSGPAFLWAEAVCSLLQFLRKPIILTLHGGGLPSFSERWPKRVGRLLAKAKVVTTPSSYLYSQLRAFRRDLTLLPNAIDLEQYPFRLRQQPHPHLIWLRAFHRIYNPALASRAAALLNLEFPDLKLKMFGPDQADGSLSETRQVADHLRIVSSIEIVGIIPKSHVPAALNEGDIFLNTADIDNTPVSVLEALASGLCVVSTNVGGIPYLLKNEENAILVDPNDAEAMAKAVHRILTEPGLAERLSKNGRKRVEEFDWPVILVQWEKLIEQVQGT